MRALLLVLLLGGCATLKNDRTVCPEARALRCATAVECDLDRARGCRVCRCQSADLVGPVDPEQQPPPPE